MMAKKKAALTGRPIGITRGRAVAEELARYYETGQQIKKSIGGNHRLGEKVRVDGETREKLMAEHGISRDQFYKTLDFACLYSQNEFRALRRHVNSETQEPLHWTHVRTLLAFSRDQVEQRAKCEKLAIKNGWSARLLLEEVQKARGEKRQGGGPKFKYKDLRRWTIEAQRYLGGLFEEVDPESGTGKLVVEQVLAKSGENLEDLKALSKAAARISELAGELSERAAKQRRSRRKPPEETGTGRARKP
jgi:hypothetical protein